MRPIKFAMVVDTLAKNASEKNWPDYMTVVLDFATTEEIQKAKNELLSSLKDYEKIEREPEVPENVAYFLCLTGEQTEIIAETYLIFLPDQIQSQVSMNDT